jgi:thiol-disulfide isomerase/thioredoxin
MLQHRSRPVALVCVAVLLLAACGDGDAGTSEPLPADSDAPGDAAAPGGPGPTSDGPDASASGPPPFIAPTLTGGELDTASFAGRPTVLWFWAPWCTTCRAEAPNVTEVAAELGDEVDLYGVAGRGEAPAMEEFVDQTGTGALTHAIDDDGAIWSDYGVAAQPAFAFIDADGEVDVVIGALGADNLRERMQDLAAG